MILRHLDLCVYLVTDPGLLAGKDAAGLVSRAIDGGVGVVQLRDKNAGDDEFVSAALCIGGECRRRGAAFILDDRVHLVEAALADGVHVGQSDTSASEARRLLGPEAIIGVSVSNVAEAVDAWRAGADYVGVSPVFATPTKTDAPPAVGLAGVRRVREAVPIPMVGIGGIDAANAASVVEAGADAVAVVRAIIASPDPARAARDLVTAVRCGRRQRGPGG